MQEDEEGKVQSDNQWRKEIKMPNSQNTIRELLIFKFLIKALTEVIIQINLGLLLTKTV